MDSPIYLVYSEALVILSWMLCVLIIITEYNKSTPHNWILKSWLVICFIISSIRLQRMFNQWKQDEGTWLDGIHLLRILIYFIITSMAIFFPTQSDPLEYQGISRSNLFEGENISYGTVNEEVKKRVNPESTSNFISRITFHYCGQLLSLGYKKPLQSEDLFTLPEQEKVDVASKDFEKYWNEEKTRKNPSVFRALRRFLGLPFLLIGLAKFFNDALVLCGKFIYFFNIGQNVQF